MILTGTSIFFLVIVGGISLGVTSAVLEEYKPISKMKKYIKRKRLMKTKKINSTEICVICFEDFTDRNRHRCSTLRGCNHKYHKKCLNDWLKERLVCPLCNIDLDK